MFFVAFIFAAVLTVSNCGMSAKEKQPVKISEEIITPSIEFDSIIEEEIKIDSSKIAFAFDFPVGKPDAKGYYDYQGFTKNNHLGEDWNGLGGGNSDLGDTIYAIANGQVVYAEDYGGSWGNTVRISHQLPDGSFYESIYTHCDTLVAKADNWVLKGEPVGTIGTAHGHYYAHLHLEIRNEVGMPIGNGYSTDTTGYENPTAFIKAHREIDILKDSTNTQ